ncbi:carbohydrate ABC transporter permease [Tengunoibacter tsumagoiensis]|uniref:ABC transporter permease n=1 Tax=Tengunoibacter tsumagoiensis TaxID=2014871 RepID=A0A402A6M0_9CHLR|nr:carbohydrate ABC transporter permease [Tengunoibacter tsumagoiensis]GCE14782.1 ABC transporter permease [Tengunoibacter tsumagoiensis]
MALFPVVGRKQPHLRIAWWAIVGVLCLGIFLHLVPFYFMIITSLKDGFETVSTPPTLWPQHPTLSAWKLMVNFVSTGLYQSPDQNFAVYFWNSIFIAGMTLLISTPVTAFAAYACSKLLRGPVGRWLFLFFIGTMMIPAVATLVPTFLLVNHFPYPVTYVPELPSGDQYPYISLFDTPWSIILPAVFNAIGFLYFKSFFDTLPDSVINAARVDGGSEFNIFRRIVLPMSIPVFAVVMSMQFNAIWDSYLFPSLTLQSYDKLTMTVAIYRLINAFTQAGATSSSAALSQAHEAARLAQEGYTWNGIMVLSILQSIPVFLVFLISFRYLLSGIRVRGLK